MRLNLYWRGRDVLDIEVHVWRQRPSAPADDGPAFHAAPHLAASDLADPAEIDTTVSLPFGFGRPSP